MRTLTILQSIARRRRLLSIIAAALWSCTSPAPSEPSRPSLEFADTASYSIDGTIPTRLGATQVDADATSDLILVARGDPSVRILRGLGHGQFAVPLRISIGSDTRDVTMADVDGDGVPDLVATGHFDNAVFVRRGVAGGGFGGESRYSLRNHGHFVLRADLNGDRFDDIVAVHDGSGQPVYVTVFLGTAGGALVRAWESGTSQLTARGLARGDFDGDGRTDIAVAVADNRASVMVFYGGGDGTFAQPLLLPTLSDDPMLSDGTASLATGDLNGDGRDDIIVAREDAANELAVYLSGGDAFASPIRIPLPSPIDVDVGDVNGDGKLDAVAVNLEHGSVSVLLGVGNGTFLPPHTVPLGQTPAWLALADLDGDGRADIAVADLADHEIHVLLSRIGTVRLRLR